MVCDKVVCERECVKERVRERVCVTKLCVKVGGGVGPGGADWSGSGRQNQKQEPHTKMWGIKKAR